MTALDNSLAGARRLTERIRLMAMTVGENIDKLKALVSEARESEVHTALGYASWTAYLADVLGETPLRLERDVRQELVAELSAQGMSTRAIAPIVGVSIGTVNADQQVFRTEHLPDPAPTLTDTPGTVTRITGSAPAPDSYWSPEESFVGAHPITGEVIEAPEPVKVVTGLDGKSYPKAAPSEPRRRSLVDDAYAANMKLWEAIERIRTITGDDRFTRNKADILAALQPSADLALEVLKNLVANEGEK